MEEYFNLFSVLFVALGVFLIFIAIIWAIIEIFIIIARYRIFEKAGVSGWKAIIPIYNKWVLVQITDLKWWVFLIVAAPGILALLSFGSAIPLAGLISLCGLFIVHYNLAIKFDKDPVLYSLGLTILPIIFYPILAFKESNVFKDVPVSEYGPFNETKINDESSQNPKNEKVNYCKNCGNKISDGQFCSKCGTKI